MSAGRVLLLVTGGIAAYKACYLARLLKQAGFAVKVAMTEAATRFVSPLTFAVLSENPVATDLWGEGQSEALDHIEYARWADLAVLAPATANTLAKAAHGLADGIVSTLLLAFPGPVLVAPAMNDNMWRHSATQANLETLRRRGVQVVGPGTGFLACRTVSEGRMAEPEDIFQRISELFREGAIARESAPPTAETETAVGGDFWRGKKVVVTAGPTYEPLDPVRFLGNRSSGAMGYALAAAAAACGAAVTLISGPSALSPPRGLAGFVPVESTAEMAAAVGGALDGGAQWLIMSAAVADFAPARSADRKLKKEDLGADWSLQLTRNPDILGEVVPRHRSDDLKVVGFALETDDLEERARQKLVAKKLDYVVANDTTSPGSGFGAVNHRLTLLGREGAPWRSESLPKPELARRLLARLAEAES